MKALRLLTLALLLALTGCATLSPDYEEPTVALTAFRALPTGDMVPSFEVGLRESRHRVCRHEKRPTASNPALQKLDHCPPTLGKGTDRRPRTVHENDVILQVETLYRALQLLHTVIHTDPGATEPLARRDTGTDAIQGSK